MPADGATGTCLKTEWANTFYKVSILRVLGSISAQHCQHWVKPALTGQNQKGVAVFLENFTHKRKQAKGPQGCVLLVLALCLP